MKQRTTVRWSGFVGGMSLIIAGLAASPSSAATTPLQAQIEGALAQHPGGIQVSDNSIAWNGGDIVMTFPARGQRKAPDGLGDNPRMKVLERLGATGLAPDVAESTESVEGCPNGIFTADAYCFYTDINWGGRRLTFYSTCSDFASNWGFDNETTSWVNTTNKIIHAYDQSGGTLLWDEATGVSKSSYVGNTNNDRMSFWRKGTIANC